MVAVAVRDPRFTLGAMATPYAEIPGVGRPARDALTQAGYPHLESLDGADYRELLALHGVGKRGLERLHAALVERGGSMIGAPEPEKREQKWTEGHTSVNTDDYAGGLRDASPTEYVSSLDTPRRVRHGRQLLELFSRATGAEPRMWGESMIGYGELHYQYATGREGDTFKVGFSPRKAAISLYGIPHDNPLMDRLGKHKKAVSCVYINKTEDVDLEVLEELVRQAWEAEPGQGC